LLLKPKVEAIKASQISFVTAVALGEALNSLVMGQTESKVQYKWPNDIFLNGKKIGGILLESSNSSFKNASEWLVVGLGVNINYSPELATRYQATDLIKESVTSCTVDRLVDLFMKSFQDWRNKWQEQGFKAIRDAWLQNSFEQGSVITAIVGKERMSGVFEDLTNDGYIKLALAGGQVCYVSAGEIFYDVNEYKRYIDNTVIKL
jgi:BirA family biotin operon repressor/biotin-[acetyl-CoA-carboxylase] ligase